jgi:hypothetical protein
MKAVTEEVLKQALLSRRLTHEKAMGSCCIHINYEELLSELFPNPPKFGELILVEDVGKKDNEIEDWQRFEKFDENGQVVTRCPVNGEIYTWDTYRRLTTTEKGEG